MNRRLEVPAAVSPDRGPYVEDAVMADDRAPSEAEFSTMVDGLAAGQGGREALTALLHEDHAVYDQRGAAAVVRMRGWILLALARVGVSDEALLFLLEELDAGHDGYLVAAAARALRAYASPRAAFAPFVMRAIGNMRYKDDAVTFDAYGAYATAATAASTPVRELLATLAWLGPQAREVRLQLEELRRPGSGVSRKLWPEIDRTLAAIDTASTTDAAGAQDCCTLPGGVGRFISWPFTARTSSEAIRSMTFEDQEGTEISFADFFIGQPSIVAFFYTRCDNPQKCSLTVSKLAQVQRQLAERGVADRVRTAAITYDPGFDLPGRLLAYGRSRAMRMDGGHRLLRAPAGIEPLRRHFGLGVNFIESLVNRHRIEVYVLDTAGRVASSFGRIHWNEREVVDRAIALLDETEGAPPADEPENGRGAAGRSLASALGTFAALAVALLPKCPVCWAAYLSVLGIAGLAQIPHAWMQPLLFAMILVNVASVGWRDRASGRMTGFYLVSAGALAIATARTSLDLEWAAPLGVVMTLAGSAASVWSAERSRLGLFRRLASRG